MRTREVVGLTMVIAAFAVSPLAYLATVGWGLLAFAVGMGGVVVFLSARPIAMREIKGADSSQVRTTPLGEAPGSHEGASHGSGDGTDGGGGGDGGT